ncbi:unnamed protein product, partial [Brenthis ino]
MMWTVPLILVSCYLTKADYDARCGDDSKTGLTLDVSTDGVEGRYSVEWCTAADRNVTAWELVMRYDDRPKENCTDYDIFSPGLFHSRFIEPITLNINCTNVCFTKYLDLIFNGTCYYIKTWLRRETTYVSDDIFHYITNPYNKEHFTENQVYFSSITIDDEIVLQLHPGYIPITKYEMELHNENDTWEEDITRNCSASASGVRCAVRAPLDCYVARFRHRTPWLPLFNGSLNYEYLFCHNVTRAPRVAGAGADAARWAAGGGAAAALLAALLAAAWRARRAAARRQRVLWDWLARREPPFAAECKAAAAGVAVGAEGAEEEEGAAVVVLLYARDCAALMRVAACLRALLQDATGCQVVDLYSASAVAAAAGGAARWLRALLRRPRARLLLLQTPAAAALHAPAPALRDRAPPQLPTLSAPLLGARAAYRRPHAGDAAFALALRLLAETAHVHPQPYRKFYVAEMAGLPAEVARGVTPLRRYVLPAAAPALLRDLAAPAPAPPPPCARWPPRRGSCAPSCATTRATWTTSSSSCDRPAVVRLWCV